MTEKESKERIAETALRCPVCTENIEPNHPYVLVEDKRAALILLKRVHPECA